MITVESPSSERSRASARLRIPSGSVAPEPVASLCSGTPNSITPPTLRRTASVAARTSESIVCCSTLGIELSGRFSRAPSRTNVGSTRSACRRECSGTWERLALLVRWRSGRSIGHGGLCSVRDGEVLGAPSVGGGGSVGSRRGGGGGGARSGQHLPDGGDERRIRGLGGLPGDGQPGIAHRAGGGAADADDR